MRSTFDSHLDQAVNELRRRLLADVEAAAGNERINGGIRLEWRRLIQRLVAARNAGGQTLRPTQYKGLS